MSLSPSRPMLRPDRILSGFIIFCRRSTASAMTPRAVPCALCWASHRPNSIALSPTWMNYTITGSSKRARRMGRPIYWRFAGCPGLAGACQRLCFARRHVGPFFATVACGQHAGLPPGKGHGRRFHRTRGPRRYRVARARRRVFPASGHHSMCSQPRPIAKCGHTQPQKRRRP